MKKVLSFLILSTISIYIFAQSASSLAVTGTTTDLTKYGYFDDNQWSDEIRDASANFGNVQIAMSNPDYKVTAGDIYYLTYSAGSTAVSYEIPVDTTYKIRVSNLGVIDASGKTYLELKKQVEEIVTRNYPLSGVQFVLKTPARFTIQIVGEVANSFDVTCWPLTRLSTIVMRVVTEYSSTRDVKVISANGKEHHYDLFDARRNGNKANNPYLCPGDVIVVGRKDRVVNINGAVERTGAYELLPGENLESLINKYASGLTISGDPTHIEVSRSKTADSKSGEKIYLDSIKKDSEFELQNFDIVTVRSFFDLQPVMFLEGAVGRLESGEELESSTRIPIQFYQQTNYAYFIRQNKNYFTSSVSDRKNAYIIRGEEIIPYDIDEALYNANFNSDLLVQENDILMVPFKQYFVTVAGAVKNPGRFPYIPDRTWDYYVGLAGGFVKGQNTRDAVEITDINGRKMTKNDVITPETTILAKTNAGLFYFNQYSNFILTLCTLISSVVSVYLIIGGKKNPS